MKKILSLLSVALFLVSCSLGGAGKDEARYRLNYDSYPVISVDVKELEIVNKYIMPGREPNVEHLFPLPIQTGLESMLRRSLLPLGDKGVLRAVIREASVKTETMPIDVGVRGWFKKEPAERLRARVLMRLELMDAYSPDEVVAYADVESNRTKYIYEGASMQDADDVYFELTKELVADINRGAQNAVHKYFGGRAF